jgi:F0F1-type ATP synthase beta subunit
MVPVGPETLGRIINVIGEPIDERGPINAKMSMPIHRDAPSFQEQGSGAELLITGKHTISQECLFIFNYRYQSRRLIGSLCKRR